MGIDLRAMARALDGEMSGRQVLAPGPGHSPHDRSLSVRLDPNAPDGFLLFSHAGDDWRECRDHVRSRLGLPSWQPGDEQRRTIPPPIDKWDFAVIDAETEIRQRSEDDLVRIQRAQSLWNEALDPRRPIVEDYLRSRALSLLGTERTIGFAGTVLRFHPKCPWRNENTGRTDFIPSLIAAFRSIDDDSVTGIHRIRLDQPKRWPKTERRMLGIASRAAIKLCTAGNKLTVGEGVETCLAAIQLGLSPAWALGSVGAISFFPLVDGVEELTILAEAGDASNRAVKICGRRWRRAGRRVHVARSEIGDDLNDALMQKVSR
jgi:Toprim domain-containing protein